MSSTPPYRPLPPSGADNDSIMTSPLMALMPTGYRNIQPFQKGKGWHSNGRTPRHRTASTQASDIDQHEKERGVVFPLLPGHENLRPGAQGPDASAVEGSAAMSRNGDAVDDRQEEDDTPTVVSPKAPSIPPTNGAPRRPSRTDLRVNAATGGSFRSRALSGSPSNTSRPASPATTNDENKKVRTAEENRAVPGPDPVLMQQLWQEYSARSHAANRQVDTAAYHEKMHRRYGEQRALKDRIAQLEKALERMEQERDEARSQADNAIKKLEMDRAASEVSVSTVTSPSIKAVRSSLIKPPQAGEPANAEEKSYRERSFQLERALSQAKVSLSALQEQLRQQSAHAAERTQALEAQLVLEQNTSLELARQLRETSAGFTRVSAELVETRVTLEKEQQRSQEMIEQAQSQNAQLLSDTRRTQIEIRMKHAVRSLGREALRHKMEALMSRTMRAEQNMRVAQLEAERVCRERDATREQLEQVLSSYAIKYHSLGASGGIPGILKRSTQLTNRSMMISGQLLLFQVLYEETEEPEDPDDGFSVHFVAYEPRSAQDDFLTFHLRDIQRLVPNHDSYLARHSARRRERLEALAELLVNYIHAGYKNGHLVLAEASGPEAASRLPREQLAAQQEQQNTQFVTMYRGTRYLSCVSDEDGDAVLAELTVAEAFAAATSQIWWLEVNAVLLDRNSESLTTKVDLRQLLTFCSTFASYRPSQSYDSRNNDDPELFGVHETLLEPLLDTLRVVLSESDGTVKLEVFGGDDESRPSTSDEPQNQRRSVSVENQDTINREELEDKVPAQVSRTASAPSTLTHRCVVNVGDVFYCVRLQELWDDELLLDITMDNPETLQHFHRVLHEPQIAKLAERLVNDGVFDDVVEENREERKAAALQVKYGLDSVLHRPLCKLIASSVQPVLPHPSQISNKAATEAGDIALGVLFEDEDSGETLVSGVDVKTYEMRGMVLDTAACTSLGWNHAREVRIITASRNVLPDEEAVLQALQEILTSGKRNVRRHRTGVRFREPGLSLVQTISGNVANCGNIAAFNVLSLTTDHDCPSYLPLVVVVKDPAIQDPPLEKVFEALGVDEGSAEFTGDVLASYRTGDPGNRNDESAPS